MGVICCKSAADHKHRAVVSTQPVRGGPTKTAGNPAAGFLLQGLLKQGAGSQQKTTAVNKDKELKSVSLVHSSFASPAKSRASPLPEGDEFLRLSEVNDIKFSGLSPVKKLPELTAKTSSTKVWGELDTIKSLFQSDKVFVFNCIDRASGEHFILKRIELSEEDMTEQNIRICKQIVTYIRRKLIPLSHPHLVKYISATFSVETRSTHGC